MLHLWASDCGVKFILAISGAQQSQIEVVSIVILAYNELSFLVNPLSA